MVSKNNRNYWLQKQARRRPHYGLRKLTVGVASVLLSTTLYMGINTVSAHASQIDQGTSDNELTSHTGSATNSDSQQVTLRTPGQTSTATEKAAASNDTSETPAYTSASKDESTNQSVQNQNSQTQTVPKPAAAPQVLAAAPAQSSSASLTAQGSVTMDPANNSVLMMSFSTSNYKKGDTFEIVIPKGSLWGGRGAVSATNGSAFTTTVTQADGSYVVTDVFNQDGTAAGIAQTISINLRPAKTINEYGNVAKQIVVKKNGQDETGLTVYEHIEPQIIVGNVIRQHPDSKKYGQVKVNEPVAYTLPVYNSYKETAFANSLTNQAFGTFDLTLNVPAHFKADIAAMKQLFAQNNLPCSNISQAGDGAPIVFQGISTDYRGTITIIGQYVMAAPASDTQVWASSKDGDPSEGTFTFKSGHQSTLTVPAWGDTILGSSTVDPEGEVFNGSVTNARSTGDLPISGLNNLPINTLTIQNVSRETKNGVKVIANFSGGYAASRVNMMIQNAFMHASLPQIDVVYEDGRRVTVQAKSDGSYTLDSSRRLQSIQWTGDFTPDEAYVINLFGKPAQGLTNKDTLTAKIGLFDGPTLAQNTQQLVADPKGVLWCRQTTDQFHFNRTVAEPTKVDQSNNNDGYFILTINGLFTTLNPLVNPHIYLVLPDTVDPMSAFYSFKNNIHTIFNEDPSRLTMFERNGKYILSYDGSNTSLTIPTSGKDIAVSYQLKVGMSNSMDTGTWYVLANNLAKHPGSAGSYGSDADTLLGLPANTNLFSIATDPVKITNGDQQQSGELAQGNQDESLMLHGTSDDKGSANMTYVRYVVSNSSETMHNVVAITNLPQADSEGKSFTFQLTSADGVKVVEAATGQAVDGATVLYSTLPGNDDTTKDLSSYKSAREVNDWSQIKSVVVKLPQLNKGEAIRIILNGYDPTLATDAGKTGVLTGQTWADEIPTPMYNDTSSGSSIKVVGQSTIHIKFRYRDSNGVDHIIDPAEYPVITDQKSQPSITYEDNGKKLNAYDLEQQAEHCYSAIKQNLPHYLRNYVLTDSMTGQYLPQLTMNGNNSFPNGAPNYQLSIADVKNGAVVQYYMDGDSVIYDLMPNVVVQHATIKFVDDNDPNATGLPETSTAVGAKDEPIRFDDLQNDLNSMKSKNYQVNSVDVITLDNKSVQTVKSISGEPSDWNSTLGRFDNVTDADRNGNPLISQQFIIHLGHEIQPVGPNSKDKYGVASNEITKQVTETVKYTGTSDHIPDHVQTSQWTRTVTVDAVTHAILDRGDWGIPAGQKTKYDQVDTPVKDGYYADKANIPATDVTQDDINVTVTYKPVGKIIPVDPKGNPIPNPDKPSENVPSVPYTNDPTDPTKVKPDEPVPSITGYTPDTTTVTPSDPGTDTKVKYVKDQGNVVIKVHDNTTRQDLPENQGYGFTSKNQDVDTDFHYDLPTLVKKLENAGYKVDNPNETIPNKIKKGTQTVTINVEHTFTTVTPENPGKPGQPVDPNKPDGPKYPDGTGKNDVKRTGIQTVHYKGVSRPDNVQKVTFTREITFDNVTGNITKTGKWNESSHTFEDVPSPVVQGYHADQKTAKGQMVTPTDLNKSITVTYTANGKIIPVDPKGNPIPNAPTPQFPTDKADPTKTTDGEKPKVPTYHPKDGQPGDKVPVPTDPGKDVNVKYVKDQGSVTVVFHDDTTNTDLSEVGYNSGKVDAGTSVDYTTATDLQQLEDQGYEYVSTDGTIPTEVPDNADVTVTVHLKHGIESVTDQKTVTRTIHYVNSDGTPVHDDTVQTVTFTRTGNRDRVTKTTSWDPWTPAGQTLTSVVTPNVPGYQTNTQLVPAENVTNESADSEVTVEYRKLPAPTPGQTGQSRRGTMTGASATNTNGTANGDQSNGQQHLPQTGNNAAAKSGIVGLLLASIAGILGLGGKRKRD